MSNASDNGASHRAVTRREAGPIIVKALSVGLLLAPLPASGEPAAAPAKPAAAPAKPKPAQKAAAKENTPAAAPAAPASQPATERPMIPKPGVASPEETAYVAKLDKAIGAVRAYPIPPEEAIKVAEAIKAIGATNVAKATALRGEIKDPVGQKLIDWYRLQRGYGSAEEYRAFLDQNPAWPDRALLTQRLHEALFTQGGSAASIKAHFKSAPPETGVGLAALASAYLAEGNETEAKALASKAWREYSIPATLETGFLSRFGKLLEPKDHKWRFDRLVIDEIRWTGERTARAAFAKRVIPLLPEDERKKAEARLSAFLQSKGALKAIEALPAGKETDWGLTFHRIQTLRRAGRSEDASKLLLSAPVETAKIVSPDEWWVERRANAYLALKAGKARLAYDLVREAGELSVNPRKEQTFMAGWLALRYLKDAKLAEPHFLAMRTAADGPLSRSKASYWLGRLEEARSNKDAATAHYTEATKDLDTFHGFLAQQKLSPGQQAIAIKPPAEPSESEIARFNAEDAVKAVVVARKASLDAHILRTFIAQLRNVFDSEAGIAMVAHLSEAVGDTQMALRTAKAGIAKGQNLLYYAYPVHPFPAYSPLRKPPETAFLLGIARQETEFNKLTVSGAGAKGLLQVMTVTAKHVCATYRVKCDIPRLISDPSYNAMMASAYIGDRMDEFRGSYVLTLAGYNAGPGRAREWMRDFGDPRDPKIDPIDWIERIPIQETREYVAKVLANVQVYRARLGEDKAALRLEEDLSRARLAASPATPSPQKQASTGPDE